MSQKMELLFCRKTSWPISVLEYKQGISQIAKIAIFIKFEIAISISIWKKIADRDRDPSFTIADLLGDLFTFLQ